MAWSDSSDTRRLRNRLGQQAWSVYGENQAMRRFARMAFGWGAALGAATIVVATVVAGAFALASPYLAFVGLVPLFFGFWLTTYMVYLHLAALSFEAGQMFDGHKPDFDRGMAVAREHKKSLSRWALIQVIIGWLLGMAREAAGGNAITATIVAVITLIAGVIWSVVTFFVIPVILFEQAKAGHAIKRSKDIARNEWGKSIRGVVRITVKGTLIYTLPGALLLAGGVVLLVIAAGNPGMIVVGIVTLAVAVVLIVMGALRIMAARYVFGVALYRFAVGEGSTGPFDSADLQTAVRSKQVSTAS